MKLSAVTLAMAVSSAAAFCPKQRPTFAAARVARMAKSSNFDLSGNEWKPDSEKMGSTDTGDFFPEGYDRNEVSYKEGMMGSQSLLVGGDRGFELPGLENLGADAVIMGGIEQSSEIPAGVVFTPSSVPDGEVTMNVASSGAAEYALEVKPFCMSFEDFYAAFSPDSHRGFSVTPATGRMDRRGGESTVFTIKCTPAGASGDLKGNLVIILPEDNSKLTYKVTARSF